MTRRMKGKSPPRTLSIQCYSRVSISQGSSVPLDFQRSTKSHLTPPLLECGRTSASRTWAYAKLTIMLTNTKEVMAIEITYHAYT
jgi:hypothetical protein